MTSLYGDTSCNKIEGQDLDFEYDDNIKFIFLFLIKNEIITNSIESG